MTVTGAAGFVAAALVRRLVADGCAVQAWVRPTSDLSRLTSLAGGLELLRLDLGETVRPAGRSAAAAALRAFRPDVVVHAAWQGVRGPARDDPDQVENVAVGLEVVRLAAAAGARRLVGLGSQAEYGPRTGPSSEETLPAPDTVYGAAKLALGQLTLALARRLGLSAAWVRVFSVYGPGEREGALLPDLARALVGRRDLPLGAGEETWDYLYEDDAAEALAMLARTPGPEGVYNLGSGRPVRLREVMEAVRDRAAPGAPLLFGARAAVGPPAHLEADVTKLSRAIGWTPTTSLAEGLDRTVGAALTRFAAARG